MPEINIRAVIMGNPIARAFAILGDAWTQLIMREAFYGVRRFSVWHERLGIPRSVLTDRLQKLVAAGLLHQVPSETGVRTEYRLTTMGLDMFGVAVIQGQWEKVWASSPLQDRYRLTYYDRATGEKITPAILDKPHGSVVQFDALDWKTGPGLVIVPPPTSRRRRSTPMVTDRPIIDRSTEIMGDYWSWAVLSAAYFRLRRFDEIHEALGVATNILADRLNRLVLQGVLERVPYQNAPVRFEYRLTEAGRSMHTIVLAMHGWAERWLLQPGEAPLTLIDRASGIAVHPVVCALETGEPMDPHKVYAELETA